MADDNLKKSQLAENMRFYGDMRFKQLTLLLAWLSAAAYGVVEHGNDIFLSKLTVRQTIAVGAMLFTGMMWVMEVQATVFWRAHRDEAAELWPLPTTKFLDWLNATNALQVFHMTLYGFWWLAAVYWEVGKFLEVVGAGLYLLLVVFSFGKYSRTRLKHVSQMHSPHGGAFTWKRVLKSIAIFVLGVLFSQFVLQWCAGLLPGPSAELAVIGFTANTPTTAGCVYYQVSLVSDGQIEYSHAKIQLPNRITSHCIGMPIEAELPQSGRVWANLFACGKDERGECVIKPPAEINLGTVQAYSAGNMLTIQVSKCPQRTAILGMVATNIANSSITPKPALFCEGEYEYTKLGQTVRKPIAIRYVGTKELE